MHDISLLRAAVRLKHLFLSIREWNQRGSVIVLVAGCMVVLLGLAGLVVDSGRAFLTKSQLSRAVDAGVLAGARSLRGGEELARREAIAVARANGVSEDDAGTTIELNFGRTLEGDHSVTMTARRPMRTSLMRLLGADWVYVASTGTAVVPPIDLVLVLDQSGSLGDNDAWDDLQRAARGFVALFDDDLDQFGLVSFHTQAAVRFPLQGQFTRELQHVIDRMRSLGWTNTAAGLEAARGELNSERTREPALKVVVFFTDGRPTAFRGPVGGRDRILAVASTEENLVRGYFDDPDEISMDSWDRPKSDACRNVVNCKEWREGGPPPHGKRGRELARRAGLDAADRLRADGVYIYAIGLGNPLASELARPDLEYLSQLANEGGVMSPSQPRGKMYFSPTASELDEVFRRVAYDLVVRLSR